MLQSIKELKKRYDEMSLETIAAWKYIIITLIVADFFGLWWYLGLKKLAMAVLIVLIVFFVLILLAERKFPVTDDKMEEKEEKPEEKKEKKDKKDEDDEEDFGFGLPSPEEYNRRLEKALAT